MWSDGDDPVTLVAKGLVVRDSGSKWNRGLEIWKCPEWSDKELNDIKTSEQANSIARNFIGIILPCTHAIYRDSLVDLFSKLELDFSTESQELLELGITESIMNDELMGNPPLYEKVLNMVLSEFLHVEEWRKNSTDEYNRALQAEYDFEYINHIIEEPGERFTPVENALKVIVTHRMEREGYSWILSNPAKNKLIKPWIGSVYESNNIITEELEALVAECDSE